MGWDRDGMRWARWIGWTDWMSVLFDGLETNMLCLDWIGLDWFGLNRPDQTRTGCRFDVLQSLA